jgi:hypothetical protein
MGSEFIDDSQLHVRVRYHGKRDKLMVDVTEITRHRTSKARAGKAARNRVKPYGVSSMDYSIICDTQYDRKVTLLDGTKSVVHIRHMCFAFAGISG